ncbi:hypothetical protein EBZ39_12445 [bacterium]|nr:hypothetical protein [bacterium]
MKLRTFAASVLLACTLLSSSAQAWSWPIWNWKKAAIVTATAAAGAYALCKAPQAAGLRDAVSRVVHAVRSSWSDGATATAALAVLFPALWITNSWQDGDDDVAADATRTPKNANPQSNQKNTPASQNSKPTGAFTGDYISVPTDAQWAASLMSTPGSSTPHPADRSSGNKSSFAGLVAVDECALRSAGSGEEVQATLSVYSLKDCCDLFPLQKDNPRTHAHKALLTENSIEGGGLCVVAFKHQANKPEHILYDTIQVLFLGLQSRSEAEGRRVQSWHDEGYATVLTSTMVGLGTFIKAVDVAQHRVTSTTSVRGNLFKKSAQLQCWRAKGLSAVCQQINVQLRAQKSR